jgi:hypothetical protein
MGNRRRFRPSPALVISLIALFVAMGGIGYAAATIGTSDIKNGAVTTKKLHNNAVATKKIKNNAVTGAKANESSFGLVPNANHANTADNATSLGGSSAGSYVQATDFAYGEIAPAGAIKSSPPNRNINSVTNPLTGLYCVDLAFSPTFGSANGTGTSQVGLTANVDIPATGCPAGTDASVYVENESGALVNDDFTVIFGSF